MEIVPDKNLRKKAEKNQFKTKKNLNYQRFGRIQEVFLLNRREGRRKKLSCFKRMLQKLKTNEDHEAILDNF